MATRYFRNHHGGVISYWTAWRVGFLTASCGGFLFALLVYIFGKVIVPDFLSQYQEMNLQAIEQTKPMTEGMFGEAMYNEAVSNLEKMTLGTIAFQEFITKSFGGIFVAFITAAAMQKKQAETI